MKKINEQFKCDNCGKLVPLALKTCRNHCPYCFSSKHVDGDIPGDRSTDCLGNMYPFEFEIANGGVKIHFKCVKCGKLHWNKSAVDDEIVDLQNYINKYKLILETI